MYFLVKKAVFLHGFTGEMEAGTHLLYIRRAAQAGHDEDVSNGIIQSWDDGWGVIAWHGFTIIWYS
jgi:hypothetical protein